ncbi:hypothetical protein A0H81_07078 [Grifola frondosa]|uniref:Uncharacterized protein n=1 Tax=Grifola frondosa TaxID=5627 RepID=A0A1C7ME20_GRIFR|nr:hypothetical protein A0H81_07078 [Grifola frondosa]
MMISPQHRHVCGHEWITNNPGGTKEQFEAFWKSLSKAAKNSFVAQAKALKSSTSSVPSVSQTGTIDSIQSVSQPGAASAVLSQPGAASAVPSQPGAASAVPPQSGTTSGVPSISQPASVASGVPSATM